MPTRAGTSRNEDDAASAPVLLLQGPVGPFFGHLARALIDRDRSVDRVRFHSGDRFFGKVDPVHDERMRRFDYAEGADVWASWLRAALWRRRYAAIVMFGAERPQHVIARDVAAEFDVPVICLEEGYVRGGHVTVELDGNNVRSPLAGRLPPRGFDVAPTEPLRGRGFRWLVLWSFLYYGRRNIGDAPRERELYHKVRRSIPEVIAWARNFARWALRRGDSVDAVLARAREFDLVPLQVHDDAQLGMAAMNWTNRELIAAAIESLAKHAPAERHLVFKTHPLERGHTRDDELIASLAREWGVSDRVHCIMTGMLGDLVRAARGMIVINSTSGLSALHAGKPLLVLGRAVYAHPELARCGGGRKAIDRFWTDDFVAPARLRRSMEQWIVSEALVPGDLYDPSLAGRTAGNVADRVIELATAERTRADGDRPWWEVTGPRSHVALARDGRTAS